MISKLLLVILPFIVMFGVGLFFWQANSQARNVGGSSDISGRAEEFIRKEKESGTGTWSEAELTQNTTSDTKPENSVVSAECFTFRLPFKSENHKEEQSGERCVFSARVVSPPSRLIISSYQANGSFEEDTGIVLRRSDTKKYTEKKVASNKYRMAVGFADAEGIAVFGFAQQKMFTVAFSSMQQPERLDWEKVEELVDSVEIK